MKGEWYKSTSFQIILFVVLYTGALFAYHYVTLENTKEVYDQKIASLSNNLNTHKAETSQNLETIEGDIVALDEEFRNVTSALESELNIQIESVSSDIRQTEEKIKQVEEDTASELEELGGKVASASLQSGAFSTDLIDDVLQAVVSVLTSEGQGSGVIVDEEGYVVTNYHVIEDAVDKGSNIIVQNFDGDLIRATFAGAEVTSDIAVLKILEDDNFDYLRYGSSKQTQVGERVIAVGNPGGLGFTVTEGIVSSTNRKSESGVDYIQTDVPINPGNSGGPLVNTAGRIVGINTLKLAEFEGIGFAVASDVVDKTSNKIIEDYKELLAESED